MKKFVSLLLSLCFIFALCACTAEEIDDPSEPESDTVITVRRLHAMGGEAYKPVTGNMADDIIALIDSSAPTGRTMPALNGAGSDDENNFDSFYGLGVESWTTWVEADGKLYRFSKDFKYCAEVETLLGEGQELECPQELAGLLADAWDYWPYDTYKVAAGPNHAPEEPEHLYSARSAVKVEIKSVKIKDESAGEYDRVGILTFTVESKQDVTLYCNLICNQSDDNLGSENSVKLELKAGKKQEASIEFEPYGNRFVPMLFVDKTKVIIDLAE